MCAIVIANGRARKGTLVQAQQGEDLVKGKVADIDFVNLTIDIAVDGGKETVTVPALEVHRLTPQPTLPNKPKCDDCRGNGKRRSLLGVAGKLKPCQRCDGTGERG
eukprot:TRINITY_DN1235_c0_g1_i2.p1 TRINITY_DN1235_c0_g1~~TRINITY_DN1235_c0_g1_i2.p1  ORF type:complete len:119 (+),score=21.78 TRINITY_DN1235_c0_g1_i2:41-358(+)